MNELTQAGKPKNTTHKCEIPGVTGVKWLKSRQKWRVRIELFGGSRVVGEFDDLHEAISARIGAEHSQEYLNPTIPKGQERQFQQWKLKQASDRAAHIAWYDTLAERRAAGDDEATARKAARKAANWASYTAREEDVEALSDAIPETLKAAPRKPGRPTRAAMPSKPTPKAVQYPAWLPVLMRAGIVLGGLAMLGHALV